MAFLDALKQAKGAVATAGKQAVRRIRQREARLRQERFVRHLVSVTGSCGKTTTTALAATLLGLYGTSVANHINVGTSLMRVVRKLRTPIDFVVQETGGHAPGAIEVATRAFRIDVAVVTSVGLDHGRSFRPLGIDLRDAIAGEKGKLVEAVAPGGFACLNFDDSRVRTMASRTHQRVVGFGVSPEAEVRATNVEARWPGRLHFDLVIGGRTYPVATRFVGTMMLTNILGALAVVHGLGLDIVPAIEKLASVEPVRDRMGVHAGADGKIYILDTEKAPHWSTMLLVANLPAMAIPGLTFVLGDMSDIMTANGARYREVIKGAARQADTVILTGQAVEHGERLQADLPNLVVAPTAYDVAKFLDSRPPGVVLLKSSGKLQLWRVLEQVTPVGGTIDA